MSLMPKFLAGLSMKAAAGLTVAAAAVGGGAAATVVTHSVSPVTWAQDVVNALQTCKTDYLPKPGSGNQSAEGQNNVGRCISATAKTHGAMERATHAHPSGPPSPMPTPRGQGRPTSLPTPPGKGRPNSLPAPGGPPSSLPPSH